MLCYVNVMFIYVWNQYRSKLLPLSFSSLSFPSASPSLFSLTFFNSFGPVKSSSFIFSLPNSLLYIFIIKQWIGLYWVSAHRLLSIYILSNNCGSKHKKWRQVLYDKTTSHLRKRLAFHHCPSTYSFGLKENWWTLQQTFFNGWHRSNKAQVQFLVLQRPFFLVFKLSACLYGSVIALTLSRKELWGYVMGLMA